MYQQQDDRLRDATAQLLSRSPGHELRSPSSQLFKNAREHPLPPHPELKVLADDIKEEEELAHANDFWLLWLLPLATAVVPQLCDAVDEHFANLAPTSGAAFAFLKSNA